MKISRLFKWPQTMEIIAIPKEAFTGCFWDVLKYWQQCMDCRGNYFEGDRSN